MEAKIEQKRVRDVNDSNWQTKQIFDAKRPSKILKYGEKLDNQQSQQENLWNTLRETVNI